MPTVATPRAANLVGKQTFVFRTTPSILGTGAVVGPKEGNGPLGAEFDHVYEDVTAGQKSFEKAERAMLENACLTALQRAGLPAEAMTLMFGGDLLNQVITTSFVASTLGIPTFGLYSACSTSTAGLALSAMAVDGGYAEYCLTGVSSHNSTAERQYRYPTEYGFQAKPWAQWTATAAGAAVVGPATPGKLKITHATCGIVTDRGVKDPYQVGAAMAPAATHTILQHLEDTGRSPDDYDVILTGDLSRVGSAILRELLADEGGIDVTGIHQDCGVLLYGDDKSVMAGGSGCGCSAVVAFAHIFRRMQAGEYRRILMAATGALHSPTSYQQGEVIPCVCHAVAIEA